MGAKDKSGKYLESYNDVFADIFNVLLFEKEVINPDSLVSAGTETIYKAENGNVKNQIRDVHKHYNETNVQIASLGIENQSDMDQDMAIRVLGYDYAGYREQINNGELRRYPVITIVLNFSDKRWSGPKSLVEGLDISEELREYVEDYHIKVFDIAYLPEEIRKRFKSDFKVVADFFAERRLKIYNPYEHMEKIKHVEAVLEMLKVYTKDERYGELEEIILRNNSEGSVSMCEILDEYERRGIEKGKEEGIIEGRKEGTVSAFVKMVIKNKITIEEACEELNMSLEQFNEKMKTYRVKSV